MRKLLPGYPLRAALYLLLLPALLLSALSGRGQTVSNFATLALPSGIAHDATGNLYVTTYSAGGIKKITPAGVISTFVADGTFLRPSNLVFDGSGNLYVSNNGSNNSVHKITSAGVASVYATGIAGPRGLDFLANGNLLIASQGDNEIKQVTPAGVVSTYLGNGSGLLNQPTDVLVDAIGNVYIANYGNSNVLKVTPGGVVSVP